MYFNKLSRAQLINLHEPAQTCAEPAQLELCSLFQLRRVVSRNLRLELKIDHERTIL
jgi:hypothetical protein